MSGPYEVYRAYDADDQLLYIGMTYYFELRRSQHARTSHWFADAARWTVEGYPSRDAATEAEAAAILAESPLWNRPPDPGGWRRRRLALTEVERTGDRHVPVVAPPA